MIKKIVIECLSTDDGIYSFNAEADGQLLGTVLVYKDAVDDSINVDVVDEMNEQVGHGLMQLFSGLDARGLLCISDLRLVR